MILGVFLSFALFFYISLTSAFPSNLRRLSLATGNLDSITFNANITNPNLLIEESVSCLNHLRDPPPLVPSDCGQIINGMILQEPNVMKYRMFKHNSYMTEAGNYARSEWQYGNCEVSVSGKRHASQLFALLDVALTADQIIWKCVHDFVTPIGGVSLIGDVSAGFYVILQGYVGPKSISAKNPSVSQQPAVSVSRRAIRSQDESEQSAASRLVETRDPLMMSVSRVSNHPAVASNFTLGAAAPPRYPVRCFNPLVIHLQPAAATDCGFIINQVILRLFDPTRQLTFGFTDVADVDLSKPEYRKWQFGQCMISLRNDDVASVDTFRLLDVATTARSITTLCLVTTQEKIGGVATIGTEGSGFYIFVGAPVISSLALSDVMLLSESSGVESF